MVEVNLTEVLDGTVDGVTGGEQAARIKQQMFSMII
jgi:hypothetical protein